MNELRLFKEERVRHFILSIVCLGILMACEKKPTNEMNEAQFIFNKSNESNTEQTNPYNNLNRWDSRINTNWQGSNKNEYPNGFNIQELPRTNMNNTPVSMYDSKGNWYWGSSNQIGNSNSSSISMYDSKGNWYWGSSNQIGNSNSSSISMYDSKGNWYWGSSNQIGNSNLSSVSMYDSKGNWYWGSSTKIGNINTMNLHNGSMNNNFGTQNNLNNTGSQNQFGF